MRKAGEHSHDVVESTERHDGRQAEEQHELESLRLNGLVYGLQNLELVEEALCLLLKNEPPKQES